MNKIKKNLLEDDYIFEWLLGKGSFGEVWQVIDKKTKRKMAFKIETKKDSNKAMLRDEYKIYLNLINGGVKEGIPKIYEFLQTPMYNILVMELLDKSVEKIFTEYDNKFTLSTVLLLGINMIKLLENVHNAGYIHRDIKPNNFMVSAENNKLYIMDFGLSKKYRLQDNKHISLKTGKSITGTPRYVSANVHMGLEPSRRDDLISVGYMLIYFIKGKLPWQGKGKKNKNSGEDVVGNIKLCIKTHELCKGIDTCFQEYLTYCMNLKFDTEPDYNYLQSIFEKTAKDKEIKLEYEWIKK
jgi:serine/threonine protein kinase